ncbi:hypothetical protein Hdeb2414_s0026g00682281 [Helianthus debilis subsp. tardiflorus]
MHFARSRAANSFFNLFLFASYHHRTFGRSDQPHTHFLYVSLRLNVQTALRRPDLIPLTV